jgi:hypothetical protein
MKVILTIITTLIISTSFGQSFDSLMTKYLQDFKKEAELRNVSLNGREEQLTFSLVKNMAARVGSYGQTIKNDSIIEIRFDQRFFKKAKGLKLEYLIFHELAHALLNRKDLNEGKHIMNAQIFSGNYVGLFRPKLRKSLLDDLFIK